MELRPAKHDKRRQEFNTDSVGAPFIQLFHFPFASCRGQSRPLDRTSSTNVNFHEFWTYSIVNEERLVCKIHILDNYPTCYIQWHIYRRPSVQRHLHSVALHLVHLFMLKRGPPLGRAHHQSCSLERVQAQTQERFLFPP